MRIKKGFTLAEILIVLMVIGVIATMTVPTLLAAVNEQQFKTAYKKAFNQISNIMSVEAVGGTLPGTSSVTKTAGSKNSSNQQIYQILASNLSFKGVLEDDMNSHVGATMSAMKPAIKIGSQYYGAGNDQTSSIEIKEDKNTTPVWLITEDNLAYSAFPTGTGACKTKAEINNAKDDPYKKDISCFVVMVDVNGLGKTPNTIQGYSSTNPETQYIKDGTTSTPKLTGDRYYIYVGRDGATAGNPSTTLTGRLVADIK